MRIEFSVRVVKLAYVKLFFLRKRINKRARKKFLRLFYLNRSIKKKIRKALGKTYVKVKKGPRRMKKRARKFLKRWTNRITQFVNPVPERVEVMKTKKMSLFGSDQIYNQTKEIVLICPTSFFKAQDKFLGSSKDIKSLEEELTVYGNVNVIGVNRNDFVAKKSLKESPKVLDMIKKAHMVFFSIPGSHLPLIYFLNKINRKLVVRSHNPEFPHRLEYFSKIRHQKALYLSGAIRGLIFDTYIKNYCQGILVQTDIEIASYWNRLPRRKKTASIYDFCYIPPLQIRSVKKEAAAKISKRTFNILGIVGTSGEKGGLSELDPELCYELPNLVQELDSIGYQLLLVGNLGPKIPMNLKSEYYENPIEILQEMNCIVVPSKLGFGTKTKIVDALFWGQDVIVHERLGKRLHSCLADKVIIADNWKINNELMSSSKGRSKVPFELVTKRKLILDELLGNS